MTNLITARSAAVILSFALAWPVIAEPFDNAAPTLASSQSDGLPAAAASKVVLYEEDKNDPSGHRYVGSVVWHGEPGPPAPGGVSDTVISADIEIPELQIGIKWSLRRNDDKALAASHLVEIMFTLPVGFSHGGISNIPGLLMKPAEESRGVPLTGRAVKVAGNVFRIGLTDDTQRNMQLLKERAWFDVPIVYDDGRRAILAIEKGARGERIFSDAFAAWGQ